MSFRGDSNLFLSGSYDNTVKLWDLRSTIPLFTIGGKEEKSADKVFAVDWCHDRILYGGTNKKLVVYEEIDLSSRE